MTLGLGAGQSQTLLLTQSGNELPELCLDERTPVNPEPREQLDNAPSRRDLHEQRDGITANMK
ncbi:hypothetical protein EYF80_019851 [Liparis tanakae]|uniref:Uncharacterized protein n=1 Tax=Liparis tanakae TaxID=230148 RepID=A0A4Z2HWC1_9TELE|nr:hypothetical protein EYF80_019851 [Liparis tanakae]